MGERRSVVIGVTAVTVLLTGCHGVGDSSVATPMPAATHRPAPHSTQATTAASPPVPPGASITSAAVAVAVRTHAYLDALVRADCAAAIKMALDPDLVWCGPSQPRVRGYEIIGSPIWSGTADKQWCVPTQIVVAGGDVTLPDGKHQWSYCFVERRGSWLLANQGAR